MKSVSCLLVLAAGLAAQPADGSQVNASAVRRLNSTLLTLLDGASRVSVKQELTTDLAELADPDHRPSQKNAQQFADALTAALFTGKVQRAQLSRLTVPIVSVLYSAGTSTIGFVEAIKSVELSLISFGVSAWDARRSADFLRNIGMQVRGPEDFPVDAVPSGPVRQQR